LQGHLVLIGAEMLQAGTRPTILVVEDYVDTQQMLKLLLEGMGFSVLTAERGNEAIAAAANNHIDLVLTDFNLPDMLGPTVIRRLRQFNPRLKHVPTIMLTAFDGYEYRNLAAEAGCDAYVVKPPNFDTLLGIIDRLLRADQAKRETLLTGTR
jgi:DNA-binding response OmpR family regulator